MPAHDPSHRLIQTRIETRFIGMAAKEEYNFDVNLLFGEILATNEKLVAANELLKKENAELRKAVPKGKHDGD